MNLYTLHNDTLTVALDACGAVLHSIVKDGAEYLWQGNAKYWARRDANLFPYVGRLTDGQYLLDGKTYPMTIHGFCIGTDFAVTEQTESSIRFTLRSNEKTLSMYPFHFTFHVCYTLRGNQIRKTCLVENRDSREMYFGIGGHPGFNVPLNGEGSFEDWELEGARSTLLNAYASMGDSQGKLENFYLGQAATGQEDTPELLAEQVRHVTAERIFDAMQTVSLDTVYFLKGKETAE